MRGAPSMEFETKRFSFKSSNNINTIRGKIMIPKEGKIKGIVQICHGMCEYIDNYDEFSKYLLEQGYIVCGHDHAGHGKSVNSEKELGYLVPDDGYKFLIEDTKKVTDKVKKKYKDLDIYLFGHSMGSLISRCYAAKYGDGLKKLVICGTVGPQVLINAAIKLSKIMEKKKGDFYRSKKLYEISLDFANIQFIPKHTQYDWISTDEEMVERFVADPKSNFVFTVSGFENVFHLVNLANSLRVIKTTPKDLPVLFISGSLDPVGENGIGVKRAVSLYKATKMKNIKCKIYKDCRHSLINEANKFEIYKDICDWIEEKVEK